MILRESTQMHDIMGRARVIYSWTFMRPLKKPLKSSYDVIARERINMFTRALRYKAVQRSEQCSKY